MSGLKTLTPTVSRVSAMPDDITLKQLENAYLQAANIVSMYGEKYLPIFERIEQEYLERKRKIELLTKAKNISNSNTIE